MTKIVRGIFFTWFMSKRWNACSTQYCLKLMETKLPRRATIHKFLVPLAVFYCSKLITWFPGTPSTFSLCMPHCLPLRSAPVFPGSYPARIHQQTRSCKTTINLLKIPTDLDEAKIESPQDLSSQPVWMQAGSSVGGCFSLARATSTPQHVHRAQPASAGALLRTKYENSAHVVQDPVPGLQSWYPC